jgi:hypothetical protein
MTHASKQGPSLPDPVASPGLGNAAPPASAKETT